MSRARHVAFNLFLTLSLILLALLPLGYLGSFGVALSHHPAAAVLRIVTLELDRGRVAFWWQRETPASLPPGAPAAVPPGHSVRVIGKLHWPPEWRRAIWEFDCHALGGSRVITPGQWWAFLLACPIWCVAIVCLILPIIWWRRRRRAKGEAVRGFAVLAPPGAAEANARPR